MEYEQEIDGILNSIFPKENWMTDEEHKQLIEEALSDAGINKQKISEDIKFGVKNGYTIDQQLSILKKALS